MKLWKLTNNAYSLILASDGRYITDSEIDVDSINLADIEDTSSWMEGDVEQILVENEIVDEIETEENCMTKRWYAVMMDRDDNDWGTGSHNLNEAIEMAKRMDAEYIAVIENDICVEEIEIDD